MSMHPTPSIILRLMFGHQASRWGHAAFASSQGIRIVFAWHRVRIWFMVSSEWQIAQSILCLKPHILVHFGPTICV
jgi:hypothetical protein